MKMHMAISWLFSFGMAGCVVYSPLSTNAPPLLLRVSLVDGRVTQTAISPRTASSIQRLEIIPYQEVASGTYAPVSGVNAGPTTVEDPNLLKIVRNAPLDLGSTLEVRGLKPHTCYRIYGKAYDASNNLISSNDAGSYLDIEIADDDRPTAGTIPIKLADTPFSGQLHLDVDVDTPFYTDVGVSLLCQSAAPTYSIVGPSSPKQANSRYSFTFSNLRANSNYQVQALASGAFTAQNFSVNNDTAIPSISLVLAPMASLDPVNVDGIAPSDVAVGSNNILYVTAPDNSRVYRLDHGSFMPFVGTGNYGAPYEGQFAEQSDIARPTGVAVSQNGNVYVADRDNCLIYKIFQDRQIYYLAGYGGVDYGDGVGPAYDGFLNLPTCLAVDGNENVYFTEQDPPRIRKIDNSGILSTITSTGFTTPCGIIVDSSGNLLVADSGDNRVKRVNEAGSVTIVAGNGGNASSGDGGSPLLASLAGPTGLAKDSKGNLFISESNSGHVRCLSPSGRIHTVATGLYSPGGLVADSEGNVYVADTGHNCLKRLR